MGSAAHAQLGTMRASVGGQGADACFHPGRSGSARGAPAGWSGRSESQPRTGRHHRRAACAHGGDDFLGVDSLQVDRGRAEVGVPELALDDVERDALAGELKRVRVAQLVRREPTPDACLRCEPAELGADRGARPGSSAGGAVDDAEERPDGQLGAVRSARGAAAPSPTRPSRLLGACRPCRRGRATTRAAGRGRVRRARALPECAARRARARRSAPVAATRGGPRQ